MEQRQEDGHVVDDPGGHGGLGDEHGERQQEAEEREGRQGQEQAAQAEEEDEQVHLLPQAQRAGHHRAAEGEQAQPHGA